MADQTGTPGSNADSSINAGNKAGAAPKDKACPFCQQPFTSSSLGRHLDLYIKEKNPKPADGVHNVDEIRKMRGGITRRQPRTSTSRRGGSTPNRNSGSNQNGGGRRSPRSDTGQDKDSLSRSPGMVRSSMDTPLNHSKGPVSMYLNAPDWHTTGVINNIPPANNNSESGRWDDNDERSMREGGQRGASRHTLAKETFEQGEKETEASDSARALELALIEVYGSIKAAIERVKPSVSPLDYDPLSMDFTALCLHCLPPPPTLNSVAPIPSPTSWSIHPPEQQQYEALRNHFVNAFQSWRISHAIASQQHDHQNYHVHQPSESESVQRQMHSAANELEQKIASHLHQTFSYWSSLPQQSRDELWRLALARAVGGKADKITELTGRMDIILQENAHLRAQNEQLSRWQQPREFRLVPPATLPIDSRTAIEMADQGMKGLNSVFSIENRDQPVGDQVKQAVAKWVGIVKSRRKGQNGSGMEQQRPLSMMAGNGQDSGSAGNPICSGMEGISGGMDIDPDADADGEADAEGDDTYSDIQVPSSAQGRVPQAPMGMMAAAPGYGNGNSNRNGDNSGHEGMNVNSYGRDGIVTVEGMMRGAYSGGPAMTGHSVVR